MQQFEYDSEDYTILIAHTPDYSGMATLRVVPKKDTLQIVTVTLPCEALTMFADDAVVEQFQRVVTDAMSSFVSERE